MIILGLSAHAPLASVALLVDGELVAAAAEERFSRQRDDAAFPERAIAFCLERARMLSGQDAVDRVAVVDRADFRPQPARPTLAELRGAVAGWTDKQSLRRRIRQATGIEADRILFVDAMRAHAANAFLLSPFDRANLIVADGAAASAMTATGVGEGASVDLEAYAMQPVSGDVLARIAADIASHTGVSRFCLSGSRAADAAAVATLLSAPAVHELFVPPAVQADGAALGAALHLMHVAAGEPRIFALDHAFWGEDLARDDAVRASAASGLTSVECDEDELLSRAVDLLAAGRVIGWAQEAAEWGSRPLGHRSVLAGLPFAAALLQRLTRSGDTTLPDRSLALPFERAASLLDVDRPIDSHPSRFATAALPLRADVLDLWPGHALGDAPIPVHTVLRANNPRFHALIERFGAVSGTPVLVEATLASPGGPPAWSADDAVAAFLALGLDALVMDRVVVLRD